MGNRKTKINLYGIRENADIEELNAENLILSPESIDSWNVVFPNTISDGEESGLKITTSEDLWVYGMMLYNSSPVELIKGKKYVIECKILVTPVGEILDESYNEKITIRIGKKRKDGESGANNQRYVVFEPKIEWTGVATNYGRWIKIKTEITPLLDGGGLEDVSFGIFSFFNLNTPVAGTFPSNIDDFACSHRRLQNMLIYVDDWKLYEKDNAIQLAEELLSGYSESLNITDQTIALNYKEDDYKTFEKSKRKFTKAINIPKTKETAIIAKHYDLVGTNEDNRISKESFKAIIEVNEIPMIEGEFRFLKSTKNGKNTIYRSFIVEKDNGFIDNYENVKLNTVDAGYMNSQVHRIRSTNDELNSEGDILEYDYVNRIAAFEFLHEINPEDLTENIDITDMSTLPRTEARVGFRVWRLIELLFKRAGVNLVFEGELDNDLVKNLIYLKKDTKLGDYTTTVDDMDINCLPVIGRLVDDEEIIITGNLTSGQATEFGVDVPIGSQAWDGYGGLEGSTDYEFEQLIDWMSDGVVDNGMNLGNINGWFDTDLIKFTCRSTGDFNIVGKIVFIKSVDPSPFAVPEYCSTEEVTVDIALSSLKSCDIVKFYFKTELYGQLADNTAGHTRIIAVINGITEVEFWREEYIISEDPPFFWEGTEVQHSYPFGGDNCYLIELKYYGGLDTAPPFDPVYETIKIPRYIVVGVNSEWYVEQLEPAFTNPSSNITELISIPKIGHNVENDLLFNVKMSSFLPDISVSELLRGLRSTLNIETNWKGNDLILSNVDYKKRLNKGVIEISKYVDCGKEINIEDSDLFIKKKLAFRYKQDDSDNATVVQHGVKEFADYVVDLNQNTQSNEENLAEDITYSPSSEIYIADIGVWMPRIEGEMTTDRMFISELISTETVDLQAFCGSDIDGIPTNEQILSGLRLVSARFGPGLNINDIHLGFSDINGVEGLANRFHKQDIVLLIEGRIVTFIAGIPISIFKEIESKKMLKWDNQLYKVQEIRDYAVNSSSLAKIVCVKVPYLVEE